MHAVRNESSYYRNLPTEMKKWLVMIQVEPYSGETCLLFSLMIAI